jgi:FMN phosphatase YigB (HAD superfamily)
MPTKTLLEYAEWLDGRKLIWPAPPKRVPVKATPSTEPLYGVRALAFDVYGTLLRISDGQLLLQHPQTLRMEIALEKTIKEFNMWNSMTRRPGAAWEGMIVRYTRVLDELRLSTTHAIGDLPEVDTALLWMKLIRQLQQKGYSYEESTYGDLEHFSEKVAFFFHSCLQGVEAQDDALPTLRSLAGVGRRLGLIADAQRFTPIQTLRAFRRQGTLRSLDELFDPALVTVSFREGIRKPSRSLYSRALDRFRRMGIAASQVLYVGTRLRDDVAVAREAGMQTALLATDKISLSATREELADPELRPDRLLTSLSQLREVIGMD